MAIEVFSRKPRRKKTSYGSNNRDHLMLTGMKIGKKLIECYYTCYKERLSLTQSRRKTRGNYIV